MATINGTTSSPNNWGFKLEVTETATSAITNSSTVKIEAYICHFTGSYMQGASISCGIAIIGIGTQRFQWTTSYTEFPANEWIKIAETSYIVSHNADGTKTIEVNSDFTNTVSPSSGSADGNVTLTPLDRTAPTITATATNISTNSFHLSASADVSCDSWQYRLNGGAWSSFNNEGETINGLSTNTEYTVEVKARKVSNHLEGTASTSFKTIGGIVRVKINGVWKEAEPFIKINGVWKRAIAYIKKNGEWKIGV